MVLVSPPRLTAGLSLRDILQLEVVQRAKPELMHGEGGLDRVVRWVHTSELAEVPSLLKGGELLLTTGLGLAGQGAAAQVSYVNALAEHGLTALALELGWTFESVPQELLRATKNCDLPFVALHEVVPFVEITEEIQSLLVHRQVAQLQLDRDVQSLLHEALLREEGLASVVRALAQLVRCPVVLETISGQIVAIAGASADADPARLKAAPGVQTAPVNVLGSPWGSLHVVEPPVEGGPIVSAALEHGPTAIALGLLRSRQTVPLAERLRTEFVEDLLAGRYGSRRDLHTRGSLLGFQIDTDYALVGFAVGDYAPHEAQLAFHAVETALAERGRSLAAEIEGSVFGVLASPAFADAQGLADELLRRIAGLMVRRGASSHPRLALGSVVADVDSLGRSLRDARETLRLVRELGSVERAVTAQGMTADRLIAKLLGDPELPSIIADEIGPLLRYDEENRAELTRTLWTYLAEGCSKTAAAKALHLRRQSLYHRLAKIEELLGRDLGDPQRRISLILALKAHELFERQRRQDDRLHL